MTPELAQIAELRMSLVKAGFRPIPVLSWNHPSRKDAGKKPIGSNWPERARQDPPECVRFDPVPHALNTGLLADGLRIFDVDIDDRVIALRVETLIVAGCGQAPKRFRRNSPRCALVYRAAEGEPPHRVVAGTAGKVQVLGKGQQLASFGRHVSGADLEWTAEPGTITLADLPVITEAQVTQLLARIAPLIGASAPDVDLVDAAHVAGAPEADIARIAAALDKIPNAGPPDWEWWNKVGMALWVASGGSDGGLVLWVAWSARNPEHDRKDSAEERWKHYRKSPPTKIGAGSLFHMADEADRAQWPESAAAVNTVEAPKPDIRNHAETEPDVWDSAVHPALKPQPQPRLRPKPAPWPEPLGSAAYLGVIGDAVNALAPHTEADPAALLLQLAAFLGNKFGRGPAYQVDQTFHSTNEFVLLAGATSRARKGTSRDNVRALFATDPADRWLDRFASGLSSGEGLVEHVCDEQMGIDKNGDPVVLYRGVDDKRLMVVESEFASVLAVMGREGATLSPRVRAAWDGEKLQVMTRNNPLVATGAHISVIGHITVDELRREVSSISFANGLLNRFIFGAVRRSKRLPFGGRVDKDVLAAIGDRLAEAARAARDVADPLEMDGAARALWESSYDAITADRPGLYGALIARAEAHIVRLALIYALADRQAAIGLPHLQAALEVWRFSDESARYLFGDMLGDPVADEIIRALRAAGTAGMSRNDIVNLFSRNKSSFEISRALDSLLQQQRVTRTKTPTAGRPVERWHIVHRATP
jgi:hypothetical protein